MSETIEQAVARRRTFAIIAHPDAGKTTLTEKLLLFGGAIQLAGEVKAKKDRMNTRSDWMKIERERGISVVTSVMTFEYGDHVYNLLDTPGHEDFADDTYRTLSAVDAKGRRWWFEVVGGRTSNRPGAQRVELLWRAIAKGAVVHATDPAARFGVLTVGMPTAVAGGKALAAVTGPKRAVALVADLLADDAVARLRRGT